MYVLFVSVYAICLSMFLAYGKQSPHFLDSILTHYELVHQSELRHSSIPHRHLSSSSSPSLGYSSESRQIHFYSLGRSFGLHLNIHRDLFSPEFDAVSVDERGESRKIHINRESFHIGHVLGDNKSSVFAHLSDGGLLSAHITTHNESYYIEPAGLYFNGSHDRHMIMYKSSDMVESGFSSHDFDYVTAPPVSEREMRKEGQGNNVQSRILKRQLNNDLNTCKLALVVDFRIYKLLLSSESTVISTLVNRMSGVDKSFRDTQWIIDSDSNTRTGFGLQIGKIIIHTEPNPDPNHYNSVQAAELGFEHLLRRFSRGDWSSYCLAHLITLRQFPSGQLGLAYIASSNADETGGICSTNVIDRNTGDVVVYNTGVSVAATQDRLLLLNEAQLVIAHGIFLISSHPLLSLSFVNRNSWGSPHDPGDNEDCRLQYIMNEFAQSGLEDSHKRFSPCSRLSIGRVLINKATCFQALSTSNCGNYIIDKEEGEECDGGRFTIDGQDPCCDSSCHLRSGLRCSDVNQACCINCTVAPKNSKICHFVGNISNDCTIETPCDGTHYECPLPLPAPEGSKCLQGICMRQNGTTDNDTLSCVSLCTINGYQRCQCTGSQSCVECCLNINGDETCQPLLDDDGDMIYFPDGIICDNGMCLQGVCVDETQDFVSLLWSVITNLNIDEFSLFLRNNIVGVVLVVSLIVWIPGACLFHWLCDVLKLWKKCLPHKSESDDGKGGSAFVAQYSWIEVKPDLMVPLLMSSETISSNLFQPVEEPEDDMPLPPGYHDYSGMAYIGDENTIL